MFSPLTYPARPLVETSMYDVSLGKEIKKLTPYLQRTERQVLEPSTRDKWMEAILELTKTSFAQWTPEVPMFSVLIPYEVQRECWHKNDIVIRLNKLGSSVTFTESDMLIDDVICTPSVRSTVDEILTSCVQNLSQSGVMAERVSEHSHCWTLRNPETGYSSTLWFIFWGGCNIVLAPRDGNNSPVTIQPSRLFYAPDVTKAVGMILGLIAKVYQMPTVSVDGLVTPVDLFCRAVEQMMKERKVASLQDLHRKTPEHSIRMAMILTIDTLLNILTENIPLRSVSTYQIIPDVIASSGTTAETIRWLEILKEQIGTEKKLLEIVRSLHQHLEQETTASF